MHWTEKIDPAYSPGDWVVRVAKNGSHPAGTVGQISDYGGDPHLYAVEIPSDSNTSVGWYDTTFRPATEDEIPTAGPWGAGEAEAEPEAEPYLAVLTRIADSLQDLATFGLAAHSKGIPVIVREPVRPAVDDEAPADGVDPLDVSMPAPPPWADPYNLGPAWADTSTQWGRVPRPLSDDVRAELKRKQRERRDRRR